MARRERDELAGLSPIGLACTGIERRLAQHYVELGAERGSAAEAARRAGYGTPKSGPDYFSIIGTRVLRKERVAAYVQELCKQRIRSLAPRAIAVVEEIMNDAAHKDRLRAAMTAIDRVDPLETRHNVTVTYKPMSEDEQALQALRSARQLGLTKDQLIGMFGRSLPRFEKMLALQDGAIEGEFKDVTPTNEAASRIQEAAT